MQKVIEATAIAGCFILVALLATVFFLSDNFDIATASTEHLGMVIVLIGWLGWMFVALVGLAFACKWLTNYIADRMIYAYQLFVVAKELKRIQEIGASAYRKEKLDSKENPHD